jgi:hypothetical protein
MTAGVITGRFLKNIPYGTEDAGAQAAAAD